MLLVYGERAYVSARAAPYFVHYTKLALPQQGSVEDDAALALPLCKLSGRSVVIWAEGDDDGPARAGRHAELIARAGAHAVGVAIAPDDWPKRFELGDVLPAGVPPIVVRGYADAALHLARARALPPLAGSGPRAVVPWLGAIDATAMFENACALLARYLAEPRTTIETIVLWCLHTWCLHSAAYAFDASPRLILHGLDARADHARALRLIAWLTPAPLLFSRTIAAHLLPLIESDRPTLLVDDIAGGILYRRDMRTLIAAGARRDGTFLTARNSRNESGRVSCFTPAAIATTATLPDDVQQRAIAITVAPQPAGEARARLTLLDPPPEALTLRAQFQTFAASITDDPTASDALPRNLNAAARENWHPLMTLALRIGSGCASRAAEAATKLSASAPPPASNLALLRDIRDLCAIDPSARLASTSVLEKLTADVERPWATALRGGKLTPRGLAERLANFGVRPTVLRKADGALARGYKGEAFVDAFSRYLGDTKPAAEIVEQ